MTAAAVLAGGASRRMGRDKAPLAVGGVALAAGVLAAAARDADPVVLVAPEGHPARGLAARVVTAPGEGPLAALAAALAALEADHVLVLAGDHPGLAVELLAHLAALAPGGAAVACRPAPRAGAAGRRLPAGPGPGRRQVPAGRPGRRPLPPRAPGRPGYRGRGGGGPACPRPRRPPPRRP